MVISASLDTNVLLDWLLDRNARRVAAIQRLLAPDNNLEISDLVISEVVYVLQTAKFPRDAIVKNLSRILNEEAINCNRLLIRKAAKLYETEPKLSWVDCCAVCYAEISKALPLYTSDKDLIKKSDGRAKFLA